MILVVLPAIPRATGLNYSPTLKSDFLRAPPSWPIVFIPRDLSSALILVDACRYELGEPCPKFSGRQEVLAYQHENQYLHTIILQA